MVFIYWLALEFFIEGLTHFFSLYRFFNVIENFLFTVFILFLASHIKNDNLKRWVYGVIITLTAFMFWFETVMYMNFKIHFGPSSFFVFLNTNPDEIREFVAEYGTIQFVVVTILFFIPLLKLKAIIRSISEIVSKYRFKRMTILKMGITSIIFLGMLKLTKLIDHNFPYLLGRSVVLNHLDTKYIDAFNAELNSNSVISENLNKETNSTFIVVIGESVTSAHMQVYGYDRNTTPFLQSIEDSLSIYRNVISPNTSTFHSLSKALTLGNYENPEKTLALPITQLFNKTKFKTFWISNHSPAFNPSSALARVTSHAQSKFFNSKDVVMNNKKHDGELLSKVTEALNDDAQHKIIFLHLIGAHFSYENRYPKEFDIFKDSPKTQFDNELAYRKINSYDNAIRYSDFIVRKVFKKLKAQKTNSYLMYFSDHGEEVFQDDDFFGHLEDRPTKNTFKIPFLMWFNDGFIYPQDYALELNRKYMTDDLWHSIVHISGIESSFLDKSRSIFSSSFKTRKRLILGGKDYETVFE